MFLIHGLSTLAFIWISEWPCVVWILINYLPLSMANSLLHSSLHYAPLAWVKQNILLEEIPFLDKSCLQRLRTCITLPITLSIHPSLENDHSCLASLPSNSTPAAPLSQDQSSQVIICSPGWWLKSFCISCSSLRNSDQVPLVLLLPPVLVITLHCPSLLYKPSFLCFYLPFLRGNCYRQGLVLWFSCISHPRVSNTLLPARVWVATVPVTGVWVPTVPVMGVGVAANNFLTLNKSWTTFSHLLVPTNRSMLVPTSQVYSTFS